MSKFSISIFLHHFLKTSKCFILMQSPLKLDIWLQSYEGFDNAKNNMKERNLNTVFANISDIRLIPLNHVTYGVSCKLLHWHSSIPALKYIVCITLHYIYDIFIISLFATGWCILLLVMFDMSDGLS